MPTPTVSVCDNTPDDLLVKQCVDGVNQPDQTAFRALVDRYSPQVYNFVLGMVKNRDLAEDLTQEVFIKVYRNLHKFDAERRLKPWVMKIAANTVMSELRKQNKVVSLDALQEDAGFDPSESLLFQNTSEDTAAKASRAMDQEDIQRLMASLEPNYRQVLLLRYTQDLPYEDIAGVMNVPVNTVRTWIRRGRDRLRKLYLQEQEK